MPLSPSKIKRLRQQTGKTQTEAGRDIHVSMRTWQGWEAPAGTMNHRVMPEMAIELFCIKNKIKYPP
jgi:DNA-binding XRE family transcriptional regulator